jgi:hypothetical protein
MNDEWRMMNINARVTANQKQAVAAGFSLRKKSMPIIVRKDGRKKRKLKLAATTDCRFYSVKCSFHRPRQSISFPSCLLPLPSSGSAQH